MPVATLGIDETAVSQWLLGAIPNLTSPLTFTRLTAGKSNITTLVEDLTGRRLVLRRPPLGELLASAHDVTREFRILSALVGTGAQIATPLALIDDPGVCDAPLFVMAHVTGVVIDDEIRASTLSLEQRHAASLAIARELAAIHAVDVDAVGLGDLAPPLPYAERQLRRWLRQWGASATHEQPLAEALHARLAAAVPEQIDTVLVHGDYHLYNMILAEDGSEVRAVLDWELSTLGDPLADLGGLLAYWSESDNDPVGPITLTTLPGFARREELVDAYVAASGRDVSTLGFWHALALWKIAIIHEGVRRRAIDEPGDGAPLPVELIDGLFQRAAQVADGAGL
jgi:aminoglycoside phosphotransferase (APT) family kinase protein